ncbi:MAG: lactonase family protein [Planctomycetales bacterium]|nr:lactonase family protein [Planctomycetales bacterium]
MPLNSIRVGKPTLWCLILAFAAAMPSLARGEEDGTSRWLLVSMQKQRAIVTFRRDESASATLTRVASTPCSAEPAIMCAARDGRRVFVSYRSSGQLASYQLDATSGQLSLLSVTEGGADPAYLQLDRSERYLLSAYYVDNKVAVHRIDGGRLSSQPVQVVSTAPRAHGIAIDASNKLVFVTHTGANRIYQFRFDADQGLLSAAEPPFVGTPESDHPRHIQLHPNDRWAYANNEAGDSLSMYELDRETAQLTRRQTCSTLPEDAGDPSQNSTARCEMTPDGRFIYVANRGHDSLAGFAIDATSGRMTPLGQFPTEKTPRSFTIEPRGRFLYAAGQGNGKIASYRIERDGRLALLGSITLESASETPSVPWAVLAVDQRR